MLPNDELASTKYYLTALGQECLIYATGAPQIGPFIKLKGYLLGRLQGILR